MPGADRGIGAALEVVEQAMGLYALDVYMLVAIFFVVILPPASVVGGGTIVAGRPGGGRWAALPPASEVAIVRPLSLIHI